MIDKIRSLYGLLTKSRNRDKRDVLIETYERLTEAMLRHIDRELEEVEELLRREIGDDEA